MIKNFFLVAYRNLAKNKATTILNITGLSIGVAVCVVIGIWLQRELAYDNFHPHRKQIFRIGNTFKSESESFSQAGSGPALGAQLPKQLPSIQSACRVFNNEIFKVKTNKDQFLESSCIIADSNFFRFFGFHLKKGQPEKVLASLDQIVISEKLAVKYFGSVANAVAQNVLIWDEYPMTVAGVCENPPINSHIQFDLVIPFAHLRKRANERWKFDIDNSWLGGWPFTYVQVANPDDWKQAEKQVNDVVARFSKKEWEQNKMSYTYFFQPIQDIHLNSHLRNDAANNGSLARVNIFSIVGIIVLLLACINYVNLTTAGAIKRAKETSVRKVVGATKVQLIRQFYIETFLITAIAVVLGVLVVELLLPAFSHWLGGSYSFDLSVINFFVVFGFILFISLIAGIYPAFILSSFKPAISLKGNYSQSSGGIMIRKTLVVFQFTISIALTTSLIIISQQTQYIKNKSLGFNGDAVVEIGFFGADAVVNQYPSLRNKLLQSPYILNVTKHEQNVVGGLGNGWTTTEDLNGEEISTSSYIMNVDTSFFDTYDMKLAAGRFFSKGFPADTAKSLIVNEAAVRTFGWQNAANAIGKRFGKGENQQVVIGVVKDFHFESLHKPVEALRIGYAQRGNKLSLKIDANHMDAALYHLRKTWSAAVPEVPLEYRFVDEKLNEQYGNENKMQQVFYAFASISLLIACLGLFGLSIYVVERKIKEIGIRKVLGASVSGIVGLLSKDFMKLVFIAAVIASPLAWYFMHEWLKDFAYRINIRWWVFGIAGTIALVIALITVCFRAVEAAMANPVKSLRTE
jgi:putative ABC transport system permease protein